jgi:hypothetical protein
MRLLFSALALLAITMTVTAGPVETGGILDGVLNTGKEAAAQIFWDGAWKGFAVGVIAGGAGVGLLLRKKQ